MSYKLCYNSFMKKKQSAAKVQEASSQDDVIRLYRIHQIDDKVRSGTYPNATTLSNELEVSVRTINRDLDILRDLYEAPLEYDSMHRGFYYTEPNFFIKYVPLKEGELFSLALFDTLLAQYKNTPIEKQLRDIFKKITSSLPKIVSIDSRFLSADVTYIPDALASIDTKVFNTVMDSLKAHCTLQFDYQPLQKTTFMQRELDPYHVVCQRGNWYVIGYCHLKNDIRIFSFSRMKNAVETQNHFKIPDDFDAKKSIDTKMGVWASAKIPYDVKLVFASEIGTFAAEHIWHEGQKVIQRKDGSVEVSFTTTQLPEVKRWVLGQGSTVKVIEPPELIDAVKEEIKKIKALYK